MNLAEIAAKSVHQRRLGTLGSIDSGDGMERRDIREKSGGTAGVAINKADM